MLNVSCSVSLIQTGKGLAAMRAVIAVAIWPVAWC